MRSILSRVDNLQAVEFCDPSHLLHTGNPNPGGKMMSTGSRSEVRTQKKVEEALRSKMKEKALKECQAVAKQFADCATGRVLSVVWACRSQAKQLNECLHQYTNDSVLDQYKREYLLEVRAEGGAAPPTASAE